ncbi:GntR family transcriptional regulator [Teichococcus vastitatis]|jgi:DNA-binding GntR family transcriptional regulator|uniref:GntR family transcriptional regulator n=1 Tax=Teichococcus vastitatis TaxID=2307076 RepID=A0ABS9W0P7_9PROT|nr:GntR family transcriptional regulator [Pseudoroseomonas vastitatis]MCI0752887.1 GntR family transcriptional regulator [Pseudoroseomonas vastitatis]
MAEPVRATPPTTLLPVILAALEEDIVFGRLHPRERLIEEEIAARFGATRHTVRQVLVELERLRLIERIPNRGALVKAYSPAEVQQLYALREMLETQAAALIPLPLGDDALAPLHALQRRHAQAVAASDARAVFRADLAFHRALYAHCGNVFLAETIEELGQRAQVIRYASLRSQASMEWARDQHAAMLDALRDGERDTLVTLCAAHFHPARQAYLSQHPALLS